MKKKDVREIIITALSLFLICAFAAGLLGLVNQVTDPVTRQKSAESEKAARNEVLPEADVIDDETAFEDGSLAYTGKKDGSVCGYVFTTSASSYGGRLRIMTGINSEGVITGIKILSIEDTPGLGMNAKRPEFLEQYTGKDGMLTVIKNREAGENEIKAITSATITSKAVTTAVNRAMELYGELSGEAE